MKNRHEEIIKSVVNVLAETLKSPKIIMFGSRAKGDNGRHSDFDFAVSGKRPPIDVERQIKEKIEKASGLYGIDIVYLDSVDKDFKEIILRTGKVVYDERN